MNRTPHPTTRPAADPHVTARPRRIGRVSALALTAATLALAGALAPVGAALAATDPGISGTPSGPWTQQATGTVGQPLSVQLTAPGIAQPLFFDWSDSPFDGLVLEQDGLVHGTPTEAVQACHDYQVTDGIPQPGTAVPTVTLCLDIADAPRPVVTGQPSDGTVGVPYSFRFVVDDTHPQFFATGLPAGLDLDSQSGLLSGTPTAAGDSPIDVQVLGIYLVDKQHWVLHIAAAAPVATGTAPQVHNTPPAGTLDQPYSFTFDTSGSDPTPTFAVESGTLPAGLQLSADGVLSGTPTELTAGSPVTVRASNGTAPDAVVTVTIPVSGVPISLTGAPPSPVAVGTPYDFTYTLAGAPVPTTAATGGSLPDGLTLDAGGHLTGTPTTPGTYSFTVTATDGGIYPDVPITSTIVVAAPVGISGTPGPAQAGQPYSFAFTVTGSPAPTVRLSTGQLPAGLTLSPEGILAGTPTASGTFPFTVVADNGLEQVSLPASLTVAAAPTHPVTPTLSIGDASVTEGNGLIRPETFRATLSAAATSKVTVRWHTDNGTAKAWSDYVPLAGAVTFAPGETAKTITVWVVGDRHRERTETFSVRLSHASGAPIGDRTGVGTIVDDD